MGLYVRQLKLGPMDNFVYLLGAEDSPRRPWWTGLGRFGGLAGGGGGRPQGDPRSPVAPPPRSRQRPRGRAGARRNPRPRPPGGRSEASAGQQREVTRSMRATSWKSVRCASARCTRRGTRPAPPAGTPGKALRRRHRVRQRLRPVRPCRRRSRADVPELEPGGGAAGRSSALSGPRLRRRARLLHRARARTESYFQKLASLTDFVAWRMRPRT